MSSSLLWNGSSASYVTEALSEGQPERVQCVPDNTYYGYNK